mgnify:FL=1
MAKPMNPVVCGISGKEMTEWRERTFVQRYIKGELVTIPLYLSIDEVIALHKQSPTYIDKKAAEADAVESAKSDAEDNAVEEQQLEGISEF